MLNTKLIIVKTAKTLRICSENNGSFIFTFVRMEFFFVNAKSVINNKKKLLFSIFALGFLILRHYY